MTTLREQYFRHVFHPHFVLVHGVGLLFGVHLAVASAFAMAHHGRRSAGAPGFTSPPGETPLAVIQAIGLHRRAPRAA